MSEFAEAIEQIKSKFDEPNPGLVDSFLVGEIFLHEHRGPNDVVWVNQGGEFSAHLGAGPIELENGTFVSPMLMDDIAGFTCFVWGADEEQAKSIMISIIRALDQLIGWDGFKITGYVAVTEEEEKGGYAWDGFSYALSGSIRLFMIKETMQGAEITSSETTGEYV